ncbi:MAG TPA: hypothetical protein DDW50_05400 [Firmicutes bacterium]|jgi:hypothetical protein|nr:hypothetical protein [Bacillota bacterium]
MSKQVKKPIQLHLELRLDYLKNINSCCEKPDFYETMSQALMGEYSGRIPAPYPMGKEISRLR